MQFQNAYDYLRWEYARLDNKKRKYKSDDLNALFERNKERYGKENNLYESDKVLFKKLEEISSRIELPIDEQDRISYAIIKRHSENINNVLYENNVHMSNDIVLGTLPINDLNAFVCPFPNGQILLALNDGLIQFIYLMGRIVASFFTKSDEDFTSQTTTFRCDKVVIQDNIKNNKDGHNKFIESLVLYFAYKDLDLSSIYFEKDENKDLSGVLWDNAELFVVAHEYSHILLDHLSPNKKLKKRFLDKDSSLYQIIRNWNDEFSADALALQTVLAHNRNKISGWYMGYLGVELCISCLDVIGKFYKIELSKSHPSAEMRKANIRNSLKKLLPEHHEGIIDIGKNIEEIVLNLWDTNKETVYDLCNRLLNMSV